MASFSDTPFKFDDPENTVKHEKVKKRLNTEL